MTATDELRHLPQCTRIAGKWYNLSVQVAAGQINSYTVECVIGVEPLPPADGVFVWSSGPNDNV